MWIEHRTFRSSVWRSPNWAIAASCVRISTILPFLKLEAYQAHNQNVRSGIRTHAPEETGALIQRLRPLGHPDSCVDVESILLHHIPLLFGLKCFWLLQHWAKPRCDDRNQIILLSNQAVEALPWVCSIPPAPGEPKACEIKASEMLFSLCVVIRFFVLVSQLLVVCWDKTTLGNLHPHYQLWSCESVYMC